MYWFLNFDSSLLSVLLALLNEDQSVSDKRVS